MVERNKTATHCVLNDKDGLINDVKKASKNDIFEDLTFIMADNVIISTNKFMLACRIPYFETMLYGGLAGTISNPVSLKCCDSVIFKHVLKFVWEGEVSFAGLSMEELLNLLETSRFLCVDSLLNGIVDHMQLVLEANQVDINDCLVAFDFLIHHKFNKESKMFLDFIDINMSSVSVLSSLDLSLFAMKVLLSNKERVCKEIELFKLFIKWFEYNKDNIEDSDRSDLLNHFNLRKFEKFDLMKIVRKSKMFDEGDICDVLEEHIANLEATVHSNENLIEDQRNVIYETEANEVILKEYVDELEMMTNYQKSLIGTQNDVIKDLNEKISNLEVARFSLTDENEVRSYHTSFQMIKGGMRKFWKIPSNYDSHFLNKVQFVMGKSYYTYTYSLECSNDGNNWVDLAYKFKESGGPQVLTFKRMKMKFLGLRVMKSSSRNGSYEGDIKPEISDMEAMFF